MTIVLISCCKTKLNKKSTAENLYQSELFKKSLYYAKELNPDGIYILSAKHYLVSLDEELEPYDVKLDGKFAVNLETGENVESIESWAKTVLAELSVVSDLNKDKFIILAGRAYYMELIKKIKNYSLPLEGLTLGNCLQWLKENIKKERKNDSLGSKNSSLCFEIHKWANELPRFSYPFNFNDVPLNGVYLFFEKGETFHSMDRIVRVGTHTGNGNLRMRLKEHLENKNKDRSIFRKNIGRAMLNKKESELLYFWNIDMTTKANREKFKLDAFQKNELNKVEEMVSKYMIENFSFTVIPVDSKEERLRYEEFIIKIVSSDKTCCSSKNWLGKFSPVEKIRNSGMWLVKGLDESNFGYSKNSCSIESKLVLRKRLLEYKSSCINRYGKYAPIYYFLSEQKVNRIEMSFEKINKLLSPNSLPESAFKYRAWWGNSSKNYQARCWLNAGFKVSDVFEKVVVLEAIR